MNSQQVQSILDAHCDELHQQFGVSRLLLFGSVARDEARTASDVDLLVDFASTPTFDAYMELKFALEAWLGCGVDLVTLSALKPQIAESIRRDAVRVA